MIRLTDKEFKDIVTFIKDNYGINLINKRELIEARMFAVLTEKKLTNFTDYFNLIKQNNSDELAQMLSKITTNHTYFMREPVHFNFMKSTILPYEERYNKRKELRIWSAGCSSGEEAYTTVMILKDYFGMQASSWDNRILATDISQKVIDLAQKGIYNVESLKSIPPTWTQKYFKKTGDLTVQISEIIRNEVIFKYLNLMEKFPYKTSFDLIFCRNVMIYFDQATKNQLINKFYDVLKPGGYLFIGLSETVQRDTTKFKYIQPSIYQK